MFKMFALNQTVSTLDYIRSHLSYVARAIQIRSFFFFLFWCQPCFYHVSTMHGGKVAHFTTIWFIRPQFLPILPLYRIVFAICLRNKDLSKHTLKKD